MKGNIRKVALAAPFDEPNFGTVLQAYALQKVLEERSIATEYLNYKKIKYSAAREALYKIKKKAIGIYKRFILRQHVSIDDTSFMNNKSFGKIRNGFRKFVADNIHSSKNVYDHNSLSMCNDYSAYIVGSDQTWSEERANITDLYFLSMLPEGSLKMSYAPSIGSTNISQSYLLKLENSLSVFKLLSCREKKNCIELSRRLGREVRYVLDPTLLLGAKEWNLIATSSSLPKKEYVLCYILGEKKCIDDFAQNLALVKKLPIYYIVTRPIYAKKQNTLYPSPEMFLALIRDAAYVVTDSFHGSVFSINFNVNFYSFCKRDDAKGGVDNDRIMEILRMFGLEGRFRKDGVMSLSEDIDYTAVNSYLEKYRQASYDYINEMITEINNTK